MSFLSGQSGNIPTTMVLATLLLPGRDFRTAQRVLNVWLAAPGEPQPGFRMAPMPIGPDDAGGWHYADEAEIFTFPIPDADPDVPEQPSYHVVPQALAPGLARLLGFTLAGGQLHGTAVAPPPPPPQPWNAYPNAISVGPAPGPFNVQDVREPVPARKGKEAEDIFGYYAITAHLYGTVDAERQRIQRLLTLCQHAGIRVQGIAFEVPQVPGEQARIRSLTMPDRYLV